MARENGMDREPLAWEETWDPSRKIGVQWCVCLCEGWKMGVIMVLFKLGAGEEGH